MFEKEDFLFCFLYNNQNNRNMTVILKAEHPPYLQPFSVDKQIKAKCQTNCKINRPISDIVTVWQ